VAISKTAQLSLCIQKLPKEESNDSVLSAAPSVQYCTLFKKKPAVRPGLVGLISLRAASVTSFLDVRPNSRIPSCLPTITVSMCPHRVRNRGSLDGCPFRILSRFAYCLICGR
jgi:hypothetical protein